MFNVIVERVRVFLLPQFILTKILKYVIMLAEKCGLNLIQLETEMKTYLKCALEELVVIFWAMMDKDLKVRPIYLVPPEMHCIEGKRGQELATMDGRHFFTRKKGEEGLFDLFCIRKGMDPDWVSVRLYDSPRDEVETVLRVYESEEEACDSSRWFQEQREAAAEWQVYLDQPENFGEL